MCARILMRSSRSLTALSTSSPRISRSNEPRRLRNAERGKESGRHRPQTGARIVLRVVALLAFDGERQTIDAASSITPGNRAPDRYALDSRHGHQVFLKLPVKAADLFRRPPEGGDGHVHSKNTLRFEARLY